MPVYGNGISLGLTDGTNYAGAFSWGGYIWGESLAYGKTVGSAGGGSHLADKACVGVTMDPEKSGLVANLTPFQKSTLIGSNYLLFSV